MLRSLGATYEDDIYSSGLLGLMCLDLFTNEQAVSVSTLLRTFETGESSSEFELRLKVLAKDFLSM